MYQLPLILLFLLGHTARHSVYKYGRCMLVEEKYIIKLKIKLKLQFKVGIRSKNNIRLAIYQYGTYTRDIEPGNPS